MKIKQVKELHRKYFENIIKKFESGCKEYIINDGKYIFPCNKYYNKENKIAITPTLYSIFLVNVVNNRIDKNNNLCYIAENKSIEFNNIITVYDKKHVIDTWRIYKRYLNIPELDEYIKDVTPQLNHKFIPFDIWLERVGPYFIEYFHAFTPYPGSEKYDNIEKEINKDLIFCLDPKYNI